MLLGFVLLFAYIVVVWLVFFQFKLLKFTIPWGFFSAFFVVHLLLIFVIGLRFVAPLATQAVMVQPTIQLTPRLPMPTLVTDVLVEPNLRVKKGTPLFQFDRRQYQYQVDLLEAELAAAKQNVLVLENDLTIYDDKIEKLKSELAYSEYQQQLSTRLAGQGAGPEEEVQKWNAQVNVYKASIREAEAERTRVQLLYTSEINGENTTVAQVQAQLNEAQFYLGNTLMVAPEDGYIMNLQVRPGMVAGIVRFGAIATFVVDSDRYLLAQFFQENLKYVKPGQPVEVAIDLYPGQIFNGKVEAVWEGSGAGQLLPSGNLPVFDYVSTEIPQGQFAVAITLDDPDQTKFPIGTQGRAAIYTNPDSKFSILRKVGIRGYTWFNWIYPFSG